MNIFMPYESIEDSVKSLDDVRLNKQILECYQIMQVALGNSSGYKNHPIVKHYIQYPGFTARYGSACCLEKLIRYGSYHTYSDFFKDYVSLSDNEDYRYFCAEGSIGTPECIRTYNKDEVLKLYKQKLINKWESDINKGRSPTWTNREPPRFWTERNIDTNE